MKLCPLAQQLLLLGVLGPKLLSTSGFYVATPTTQRSAFSTLLPLSTATTADQENNDAWTPTAIEQLQAWAAEMQATWGTRAVPAPSAHVHRTATRFTAQVSLDENDSLLDAQGIDIRLVTVGQQPYLTITTSSSSAENHSGVALDATVDLDSLTATLLPGNLLRIEGDKKAPRTSGLRVPVVDQRGAQAS